MASDLAATAPETDPTLTWLVSPDHRDAEAVAAATRLDFDQVAGRAALRSPVFLGGSEGTAIAVTLVFDAHLGTLAAIDLMGPRVGRYSRLAHDAPGLERGERGRPLLWRRHEAARGAEAETLLAQLSSSELMRHRDVGLPLRLCGARGDVSFGLPAPLLQGFLARVARDLPAALSDPR